MENECDDLIAAFDVLGWSMDLDLLVDKLCNSKWSVTHTLLAFCKQTDFQFLFVSKEFMDEDWENALVWKTNVFGSCFIHLLLPTLKKSFI